MDFNNFTANVMKGMFFLEFCHMHTPFELAPRITTYM